MSDTLNEFAINLPMATIGGVGAVQSSEPDAPVDVTSAIAIPAEVSTSKFDHISVYLDQATVSNYEAEDPCVCVDMVLSVNITNLSSKCVNSYKLVKRVSFDKIKLALQAEQLTPVQVIEAEEPEDDPLIVEQEDHRFQVAERAKEMAGIFTESRGDKTFKVMIKYDDPSGSGIASTAITVDAVKDAAHARHVVKSKFLGKYKNAKIVRAAEVKEA